MSNSFCIPTAAELLQQAPKLMSFLYPPLLFDLEMPWDHRRVITEDYLTHKRLLPKLGRRRRVKIRMRRTKRSESSSASRRSSGTCELFYSISCHNRWSRLQKKVRSSYAKGTECSLTSEKPGFLLWQQNRGRCPKSGKVPPPSI